MESKSLASWDDLVLIVQKLDQAHLELGASSVKGILCIDSQQILEALNSCLESEKDTHLEIIGEDNINNVIIGMSIKIKIAPRAGFGVLAADIDELLKAPYAYIEEPRHYFLFSELNPDKMEFNRNMLNMYRATVAFIKILGDSSAFFDKDRCSLVFIKDGKYEVPVEYSSDDLANINLNVISKFSHLIPEGIHKKTCGKIMAESVIKTTQNQPISKRFRYLLQNLSTLEESYENSYELYAEGFSYEKIKADIESAKIEFSEKIHNVLSGIQNQLLGVPLSSVIIATQMKDSSNNALQFWVNSFVFLGSFIFSVIMLFMIKNQFDTLSSIRHEVQRQQKELRSFSGNFSKIFESIEKRIIYQKRVLWIMIVLVSALILISVCAYFLFTCQVQMWLEQFYMFSIA
jgi:hypothetical protein